MASNAICSPFSQAVFSSMRKLYPESLADKSFDNTGVLLEAPFNPRNRLRNSVLLTIDLTTSVAEEAIQNRHSVVVAYHPIIFRGLKQLSLANSQQRSLLRLAQEGISVYCPHTAVDAAVGGNADWMADIVTGDIKDHNKEPVISQESLGGGNVFGQRNPLTKYELFSFPGGASAAADTVALATRPHTRRPISPSGAQPDAGFGRFVQFSDPRPLSEILEVVTRYLGSPRAFSVAIPYETPLATIDISSIGICAGSGGSVFGRLDDVDLLITGELVHHETLAAIESGKTVMAFGHSNSERGYLGAVLQSTLLKALRSEWESLRQEAQMETEGSESQALGEMLEDAGVEVEISKKDRDPFQTAIWTPGT